MLLSFFIPFLFAVTGSSLYYLFFSASSQFFGKVIYRTETKEKILALTFDDGPREPGTRQIVNFLNSYNIKGTFFQVGKNIEKHPELTQRIFEEGHTIGNHLYNHHFFSALKPVLLEEEARKTQEIIYKITGKKPKFFRPPWLFRTPQMFKILQKYGLITIAGTFSSFFEPYQLKPSIMAFETLKKARPGSILIFHDGYKLLGTKSEATTKTLKIVVPKLLNKGYQFVSLSELLNIEPYQ